MAAPYDLPLGAGLIADHLGTATFSGTECLPVRFTNAFNVRVASRVRNRREPVPLAEIMVPDGSRYLQLLQRTAPQSPVSELAQRQPTAED